jgi:hypothetical protein
MNDFVISASALSAFKRCPKSYYFGYEQALTVIEQKEALTNGIDFHTYAADYAIYRRDGVEPDFGKYDNDKMYEVFNAWVRHRGATEFDNMAEILHVEEPMFTELLPGVQLRTTLDLVYRDKNGWIVIRDYKTFAKMPSLDASLDFQARIYIAAIMRKYQTENVKFEHVYVRRDLFHEGKQSHVAWTPEESYVYEEIVIPRAEADRLWKETQYVAGIILDATGTNIFYRVDLKGTSPFTCGSCFYKTVCAAENQNGGMDGLDLEELDYRVNRNERNQQEIPA